MSNETQRILDTIHGARTAGKSLASIATGAGLHRNALYGYDDPAWNPKRRTLEALATSLLRDTKQWPLEDGK